jgi:hypothetical protein
MRVLRDDRQGARPWRQILAPITARLRNGRLGEELVCVVGGKLKPMAQVHGFWSEAIWAGVRALGFSLQQVAGKPWMAAEIAMDEIPSAVRRAAAAAIAVDKEIAYQIRPNAVTIARAALMTRLTVSPAAWELENYQSLLAITVLKRVAPDPAGLLEALAEPYE